MSNQRFVRPCKGTDGAVLKLRHPKTRLQVPAEGELIDFENIDVRTFFMRREIEKDVEIFAIDSAEAKAFVAEQKRKADEAEAEAKRVAAEAAQAAEEAKAKAEAEAKAAAEAAEQERIAKEQADAAVKTASDEATAKASRQSKSTTKGGDAS